MPPPPQHPLARRVTPRQAPQATIRPLGTLAERMAYNERIIIIQTLAQCGMSRKEAALKLGISRNYLGRRMKLLGIDPQAVPRTTPGRPAAGEKVEKHKKEGESS